MSESHDTGNEHTMLGLMRPARAGDAQWFHDAPHLAPWRRLDETAAARKPVLTWTPQKDEEAAA